MLSFIHKLLLAKPVDFWTNKKYVSLSEINKFCAFCSLKSASLENKRNLFLAFNNSDISLKNIKNDSNSGNLIANSLEQFRNDNYSEWLPYQNIPRESFQSARHELLIDPEKFVFEKNDIDLYPYYCPSRTYGYKMSWVRNVLSEGVAKFKTFQMSRRSDTAVLIGNGPSLSKIDFSQLGGQDCFISNYAIKNLELASYARGVAVTNYLVAEQEPYWFNLADCWKFYPFWLSNSLNYDSNTILLNAAGGDPFFSTDVLRKVSWHSTVSYFWLQILYSAGYRKIVLIGFDNSYQQAPSLKEGDMIRQSHDDANHFDPNYFKGKTWQAADTAKMAQMYSIAKKYYENDGREIVNSTVGGNLEVFRRGRFEDEIPASTSQFQISFKIPKEPKIIIATAFWKGDIKNAELHWRLLSRLGANSCDHLYLFKHSNADLPLVSLPRVHCLNIDSKYPLESKLPHPAGPNLVFVETLRQLAYTDYTHFFWMEPDCIATSPDWLDPFKQVLRDYPEQPIIGTGGGTVVPNKSHWKHHFCGCSLYNIRKLLQIEWDSYISSELTISFDIWLSIQLGYIKLESVNNLDIENTIIYGKNRYEWKLLKKPEGIVCGMFEHWRPETFLSNSKLEERLDWPQFSVYHAIKDYKIVSNIYQKKPKSATTIIINYNNEKYLRECIKSAINQICPGINHQVIVVDDGSKDCSKAIIESFGNSILPIYLQHGELNPNFNQQRALLAGFSVSKGEVIFLLDGDDCFYNNKIQHCCELYNNPDVVMVQHILDLIDGDGNSLNKRAKMFPDRNIDWDLYREKKKVNYYQPTSGISFHKGYLECNLELLCPDEHENVWLDVRLTRFAPLFGRVVNSTLPLGAWRRHTKSDSIRNDNILDRVRQHEHWFDTICLEKNISRISFPWQMDCPLIGPFTRAQHLHTDETIAVGKIFSELNRAGFLIDIGAHQGYALQEFLNRGWKIWAFEPDHKNRAKLLERLAVHKNRDLVTLDARCVSHTSQKNIPFYQSEESTGISGLSAFRDTHVEAQRVDTVSLSDYFADKEMPAVDFLKIDTEGHDLFVLQGFPWERNRPRVIECEFEDLKSKPLGYTTKDMADFLVGKGYTVYVSEWHPILKYGQRHDWHRLQKYPCELACYEAWGNLLAFSEPPDEAKLVAAIKSVLKSAPKPVAPSGTNAQKAVSPNLEATPCFTPAGPNRWVFTKAKAGKQNLLIFKHPFKQPTANREIIASFRVLCDAPVQIAVSLGRHDHKRSYEGTTIKQKLTPDQPWSGVIKHRFRENHSDLKLQFEILDCPTATCTLEIQENRVQEAGPPKPAAPIVLAPNSFAQANKLYREGKYAEALKIYEALAAREPLSIYRQNAKMTKAKLSLV